MISPPGGDTTSTEKKRALFCTHEKRRKLQTEVRWEKISRKKDSFCISLRSSSSFPTFETTKKSRENSFESPIKKDWSSRLKRTRVVFGSMIKIPSSFLFISVEWVVRYKEVSRQTKGSTLFSPFINTHSSNFLLLFQIKKLNEYIKRIYILSAKTRALINNFQFARLITVAWTKLCGVTRARDRQQTERDTASLVVDEAWEEKNACGILTPGKSLIRFFFFFATCYDTRIQFNSQYTYTTHKPQYNIW